jgi:hypothetical protein
MLKLTFLALGFWCTLLNRNGGYKALGGGNRFGPAYPRPVDFPKVFTFESKQYYLLFKDDPLILAMMSILELHVLGIPPT